MDKHGIGTDATHAEHIETVKQRQYIGVNNDKLVPGKKKTIEGKIVNFLGLLSPSYNEFWGCRVVWVLIGAYSIPSHRRNFNIMR